MTTLSEGGIMKEQRKKSIENRLLQVYSDKDAVQNLIREMEKRFAKYSGTVCEKKWVDESDIVLITYGDSIQKEGRKHFRTLRQFMEKYVGDAISTIHILPMFPYTSDDGFSVIDYKQIEESLGDWEEIEVFGKSYSFMFDAVINHISQSSEWFQKFLKGEEPYNNYFIVSDKDADYSKVIRPRALPLLTPFQTHEGEKYVWTTFSEDQIDLNYANPEVLLEILDVLLFYASKGARYIRLDAIGFMWKERKTTCMHLPQTHELIKIMREVVDEYAPGTILVTETNVPHSENISYFGNGYDEAGLVYQFPLPPLTMFSILTGNAEKLSAWAETLKLPSKQTTFFNFLSSHDGIGVRPTEGILTKEEQDILIEATLKHGGRVSYKDNGDGTRSPYELNINYQDALAGSEENDKLRIAKFLIAQTILLSMQGVPGIYIHSLLGSRNDYYGVETSGINRRINREKMSIDKLEEELKSEGNRKEVFREFLRRINIRKKESAFSPLASQRVLKIKPEIFALLRENEETGEKIYVLINVSNEDLKITVPGISGEDLLSGEWISESVNMLGLQARWVKERHIKNKMKKGRE